MHLVVLQVSKAFDAPCKGLPTALRPVCSNATQLVSTKLKTLGADACSIVAVKVKPLTKLCEVSAANVTAGVKIPESATAGDGGIGDFALKETERFQAETAKKVSAIENGLKAALPKPSLPTGFRL